MSLESPGERPGLRKLGSTGLGSIGKSALGSLVQSARHQHINQARSYLLWTGGLTLVFSGFIVAGGQENPGLLPPEQVRAITLVGLLGCVEGLVFIGLGLLTRKYPIPATILGLILYVADTAIFTMTIDLRIIQFAFVKLFIIIMKLFIILMLAKAVQSAIASERERQAAEAVGDFA